jgi:hypothetical protein
MAISLSLEQMSIEEKIRAMEIIWDDLCTNGSSRLRWYFLLEKNIGQSA